MSVVLDIVSWILLVSGAVVCIISAIGMMRMPDLFTRVHAASVTDTLGAFLILLGCALQVPDYIDKPTDWLIGVKLLFIMLLLVFLGPVSIHALTQAAIRHGVKPLHCEDLTDPDKFAQKPLDDTLAVDPDLQLDSSPDDAVDSASLVTPAPVEAAPVKPTDKT